MVSITLLNHIISTQLRVVSGSIIPSQLSNPNGSSKEFGLIVLAVQRIFHEVDIPKSYVPSGVARMVQVADVQ